MAKKETSKVSTKQKKKKWFHLIAPKQFNEIVIGETPSYEASSLPGKTIKTSLMNLTRDFKKQNINVRLKILELKDNKAYTELDKYEMSPSSIKRMVRRRKDRIDDSFVALTKDEQKIRVKPMILTRSNTNQSVLSRIRVSMKAFLIDKISKLSYAEFVEYVVTDKLYRDVKRTLAKIYPIKTVTIRSFKKEIALKVKPSVLSEKEKNLLKNFVVTPVAPKKDFVKSEAPKSEAPKKELKKEVSETKKEE